MKKLAMTALLATMAVAASATDVGLRLGRNGTTDANFAGVTVGKSFGAFGAEAAFDRSTVNASNVNRYSVLATYDVTKIGSATVVIKAGAAFVNPSAGVDGYAAIAGVGLTYPVAKNVKLVADYAYQEGQERVSAYNGSTVTVGAIYSF